MIYRFVLTNATKGAFILPNDPLGWDDIELSLERGIEYHGLFYEQDAQLTFYCGTGKEFIDSVYDAESIDGDVQIKIFLACNCTPPLDAPDYSIDYSDDYGSLSDGNCVWDLVYEGRLDLSTLEVGDNGTKANVTQISFFAEIRNRLDTKITVATDRVLNMHNYPLVLKTEWETIGDSYELFTISDLATWNKNVVIFDLPFILKTDNSNGFGNTISSMGANNGSLNGNAYPAPLVDSAQINEGAVFTNQSNQTVTITYNLRLKYKQFSNFNGHIADGFCEFNIYEYVFYKTENMNILNYNLVDQCFTLNPTNCQFASRKSYLFQSNHTRPAGYYFDQTPVDLNVVNRTVVLLAGQSIAIKGEYLDVTISNSGLNNLSEAEIATYVIEAWDLDITYTSSFSSTIANVQRTFDVGRGIVQGLTGTNNQFSSFTLGLKGLSNGVTGVSDIPDGSPLNIDYNDFLQNGENAFSAITTGFGVRGFPSALKPLVISMNQYFKGLDAIMCLGMGIEKRLYQSIRPIPGADRIYSYKDVLIIEEREYFYNKDIILTLNNVPDIKRSIALEYLNNQIFIGYENYTIENFTGLDEINSQREYSNNVINTENQINAISEFTTGQYNIEQARRKQYATTTVDDTTWDEQMFFIALARGVNGSGEANALQFAEKSENFGEINNIINGSFAYNLRYTPTRNLLRWFNYLAGSFLGNTTKFFSFKKGYANYLGQTKLMDATKGNYNNLLLSENQNFTRAQVLANSDPIFVPEFIMFDFPLSFAEFKTLRDTPTKSIEINNGYGVTYRGFIISIKYKPTKGLASFKLLRHYEA